MFFARGFLVLVLLLSLTGAVPAAEPEGPADVAGLFAKMRAHLARITSIEYTSGFIWKRHLNGELKESEHEFTFAYAAGKYRSKLLGKPTFGRAAFSKDHAYDGLRYQEFHVDSEYLVRSSKPFHSAYGGSQPFFLPYGAIVKASSPFTVECYLDEAAWKRVAAGAVLEGSNKVDGHSCQVVRITFPHRYGEDVRRIHVATDLEYLPILIESQGSGMDQFSLRLSNLESFQTPAGRVVIALNAVSKGTFGGHPWLQEHWINADGLKVNHAIPLERFTIPPEQAQRVHDVD